MKWLTQGDRNTKFFHQSTLAQRRRNKLMRIRNENGVWVEGEKRVTKEVHMSYSMMFTSDRGAQVTTEPDHSDPFPAEPIGTRPSEPNGPT